MKRLRVWSHLCLPQPVLPDEQHFPGFSRETPSVLSKNGQENNVNKEFHQKELPEHLTWPSISSEEQIRVWNDRRELEGGEVRSEVVGFWTPTVPSSDWDDLWLERSQSDLVRAGTGGYFSVPPLATHSSTLRYTVSGISYFQFSSCYIFVVLKKIFRPD